ncbi:lysophospholipase L1-like esterase [Idiomarina sp. A28L]|uniref:SGNH/GDSL hydrolase family protein n=1 Tax=Idiomarina sp. A28L TaxID=1036674 RepID=UPI0002138981|nr:SGNH/GDSL hydrolase family protein [Idiomarina sp. A28L]EGN76236.1 lysophospholipase L1-like esterase [Idiomarina sp. A28L]
MLITVSKIALAPMLLMQGKRVRLNTPRLPEPEGERSGVICGEKPALRVLICGDSAAAGVGVAAQHQALSGQLVAELQRRFPLRHIEWHLWAKNGDNSAVALTKLHLKAAQQFDVVVTSLGVNDVTGNVPTAQFRDCQQAIVQLLQEKFHASQIILTALPPMHLFPALPQPLRWFLGQQARRLTHELDTVAAVNHGCEVLDVSFPMDEDVIASDGFHPGSIGYKLWAQAIVRKIEDTHG